MVIYSRYDGLVKRTVYYNNETSIKIKIGGSEYRIK